VAMVGFLFREKMSMVFTRLEFLFQLEVELLSEVADAQQRAVVDVSWSLNFFFPIFMFFLFCSSS
jgi:hypothetical protein